MPDFLKAARDEAGDRFEVRRMGPVQDGDSYVIQYIEPTSNNSAALGLDIASESVRRAAAQEAMLSGEAVLSAPITLVQEEKSPYQGLLFLLPVYLYGMPTNTPTSRTIALQGWVYAPLAMSEVLRNIDADAAFFTLRLRDAASSADAWLYRSENMVAPVLEPRPLQDMKMFGRTWEADLQPTREFVASMRLPSGSRAALDWGVVGLLLSALVALSVRLGQRGRAQRLEQARRAAIVEGSNDAIIVQTLDGVITDWNEGARRLFGYALEDVRGRTALDMLVPEGHGAEDASMLLRVAEGEHVQAFETQRRHRDGTLIDVSISAGPIADTRGRVVGLAKTVRDVREVRAAARRVAELNATLEDQVRDRTAALETARHALQTVLDAMPSQIGYWDRSLRNRVANRAYGDWFGLDPATVKGMHLRDLIGDAMFEMSGLHADAALRGEARTFEQTRPGADGAPARHMLVHYLPDGPGEGGVVPGFYAFVHDVTELTESRLQLAAAQRDNAALLQTLNQHSIVSVADRGGRIVDVNDAFCRISGYARDELIGQNHRIVNSGMHPDAFWTGMWATISGGQSWRAEVCNRAKDGSLYWVDSVVAPFVDAHGKVDRYVSIRTDITARKHAELELRRTLTLLQSVLEASTQVAIVAADADGAVTLLNRGAELLLDMPGHSAVGAAHAPVFFAADVPLDACEEAHLDADRDIGSDAGEPTGAAVTEVDGSRWLPVARGPSASAQAMSRFYRATQHAAAQWYVVRADGSRVPVSLAVTRMEDDDHQLVGYLAIAADMRERLQHEQSLREAMQEANQASEAKSRFLANMSHEIRTPMNAVIGLAHLLARTTLDGEQQGMLRRLQMAGRALLSVINDVLDLSKIEAGEMSLEMAPLDMNEVLRDVAALVELPARDKGLAFVVDIPRPLPTPLEGDSTRIMQIVLNLLSNAIKFTERGEVRLAVAWDALGEDRYELRVRVSDTGIGIDEAARKRLFAPFVQADVSTTRRYGGTGLGLSIVKQLVEMMSGHIEVHSTVDQGSQFEVTLPMRYGSAGFVRQDAGIEPGPGAGLHGLRMLVVDDNEINREIAQRILEGEGASVVVASNGRHALDVLHQHAGGFDAVLMDVHMPVLNGLDATRRIRATAGWEALPVIGLTAGVSLTEQNAATAAGMDTVIGKPFDPPMLVRTIRRAVPSALLHPATAEAATPAPATSASATTAIPWPRLAGVDDATSFARLQGHRPLLVQLVQRIVNAVQALATLSAQHMPAVAVRDDWQRELHDLKGMAGTLGATALAECAQSAEAACREGRWQDLAAQITGMARQTTSWAPFIEDSGGGAVSQGPALSQEPSTNQPLGLPGDAPVWPAVHALHSALRTNDLAALEMWSVLAPQLAPYLGATTLAAVQQRMDNLAFDEALHLLDAAMAPSR